MKKLSFAIVAALGLTAGANAGVITQSAPLVLETTEINQNLSFNQFDSTLGTLTAIDITLDTEALSSATLLNTASGAQLFSFNSDIQFVLSGAGVFDVSVLNMFSFGPALLTPSVLEDLGTANPTGTVTLSVAAADFAAWTGAGTIDLNCQTLVTNTQAGGGGNITVTQETDAGCGAEVVYTFDDPVTTVPVPAPLALLGLGLAGIAGARRMKRAA